MPYIPEKRRVAINAGGLPFTKGELTYKVFKQALDYIDHHKIDYQNISDAIASLTDAAHELRRRVLDPYEEESREDNGDILPL